MAFGAKIKLTVDNSKGAEFRKSIQAFVDKSTEKTPIKLKNVEFHITKAKVNELAKTLKKELSKNQIELNIKNINAGEAVKNLKKQLETMLSGLSVQGLGAFLRSGGASEDAANTVINIKAAEQTARRNKELLTQARKDLDSYRRLSDSMTKVSGGTGSQQYKESLQWIAAFEQEFINVEGKVSETNSEQILGMQRVIANLKDELALEKSRLEIQKQQNAERANSLVSDKTLKSTLDLSSKLDGKYISGNITYSGVGEDQLARFKELETEYRNLKTEFDSVIASNSELTQVQIENYQKRFEENQRLLGIETEKLKVIKQQTKEKANQEKQDTNSADTEKKRLDKVYKDALSLQNQIKKQMTNNSLAVRDQTVFNKGGGLYNNWLSQLTEIMNNAAMGGNSPRSAAELTQEISDIKSGLSGLNAVLTETGKTGKNVWDSLKTGWAKFGSWSMVTRTMMSAWNILKKVKTAVVELDAAMTELKKVTDLSEASYARFKKTASEIAINRGSTLTDVINATADFSRLGFDIGDATEMAEAAIVYKNVGDGIDNISDASQSLISTIKAFGQETYSAMEIVDKFNKVGNEFAISSVGIGDALQKSAAALAAGGNTLEESIGLATGMNAVIQNPEVVGTALKTYSMYLRAAKAEAEEAGESTEDMANSVSELRAELLGLTNNKVDIMLDDKSFKSTYQITKELAEIWKDLSDIDQAAILEKIGGKRNGNAISSLLNNFGDVEAAMQSATNAAGSATAENEKYLNSISGKLDVLSAKFETMSSKLLNSGIVKFVINLAGAITDVVGAFASIPILGSPLLIAIPAAITAVIKKLKEFNPLIDNIIGHTFFLTEKTENAGVLAQRDVLVKEITTSLAKYDAVQKRVIANDIMARAATKEITVEQAKQLLSLLGLTASTKAVEKAKRAETDATIKEIGANKMLSISFKELMASIPVYGWIALGISTVASALAGIPWDEWLKSADDKIKELKEIAEQAKEEIKGIKSEIDNLKSSTKDIGKDFAELAQSVENLGQYDQSKGDLNTSEYEKFLELSNQLAELYPVLTKGFDENGNAILNLSGDVDTITASLTNLLKIQQQIAAEKIMEKMPDVWTGYIAGIDADKQLLRNYEKKLNASQKILNELSLKNEAITIFDDQAHKELLRAAKQIGLDNEAVFENSLAALYKEEKSYKGYGSGKFKKATWDFSELSDSQFEQLKNELGRFSLNYQQEANKVKNDISSANSEVASYINTWLSSDDGRWNFSRLSSSMQNVVKDVLLNSDWEKAIPDDIDKTKWSNVADWLNQSLLYAAQQIDDEGIRTALSKAFDNALSVDALSTLIENIKESYEGFDENNPLIIYLQTKLDNKNTLINDTQKILKQEDYDKIELLSNEDLEIAAKLTVPEDTFLTFEQLKQKIEAQKNEAKLAALVNKDYAESIKEIKEAADKALKNKELFDEAVEKIRNGEDLDYDTVSSLIEVDPSIAPGFIKTANGYKIAIDTLIEANEKYIESDGTKNIKAKISETKNEIEAAEKKIQELAKEKAEIEEKINSDPKGTVYYLDGEKVSHKDFFAEDYNRLSEIEEQINGLNKAISNGETAIAAYNLALIELGDGVADKFSNSYVAVVSNVESITSKLEILANVYKDVQDKENFDWSSILNNDAFKSAFANCTETYSAFIETVTQFPSDIDACQEAFDNLVTEYINNSGILDNLSEETKDATVAMLEQMGVVNALEIANRRLADERKRDELIAEAQRQGENANYEALLKEAQGCGIAVEALLDLALKKMMLNDNKIDTADEVDQIIALANAAGASASALIRLNQAKLAVSGFDEEKYDIGKEVSETSRYKGKLINPIFLDNESISAANEALAYFREYQEGFEDAKKALEELQNGTFDFQIFDADDFKIDFDGSNVGNSNSLTSTSDSRPKTFDWIERAIEKVQRAFNKLGNIAKSVYKALSVRNGALSDEIGLINKELQLQQTAYNAYMAKAASVGLSADLISKIQNGAIDISDYDEDTAEIIDEYKEWYDKAQDCKDAIDDLHESLAELYKERFENISKDFENQLSQIEHISNMYNVGIDTAEAKGYLESVKYYTALQDSQRNSLYTLNQELSALKYAFSEAMNSGEIEMYSDAWYEMQDSINGVTEEIMKGNQQMAEYAKTIREIEWGHFDYLQERISQITQEAEFLIDLLDNKNLFDDKGQFTGEGMAALGLYAQNYNVYMAQADKYAQEIRNIEEQMAKDPYNADLIKRKEELIKLQQESVLAAEDEKQAMIDLVKEGIEKELAALKDLIDAYTKTLDEAADLRSYQKKISEQAEQIANLEKQLSAKAGDTSEEAKADIQKLQVELEKAQEDLQESEYERYVSEQKKLLDEMYTEYKDILNRRLDDIDALVAELVENVNANAENIAATIEAAANDVGYDLSDSFKTIWEDGANGIIDIVSVYGDNFLNKLTTVNEALGEIESNTAAMIKAAENLAYTVINSASSGGDTSDGGYNTPPAAPPSNSGSSGDSGGSGGSGSGSGKTIKVGGKINAKGAPIYDYVGDKDGEHQVFAYDPIYTVLDEINGYLKVRWHKLDSGVTGWFKRSDVTAYKTGGLVNYTGLAQLDGSPSRPEYVLNPDETRNFLALNNTLKALQSKSLLDKMAMGINLDKTIPALNGRLHSGGYDAKFGDINISIDHVENYDDLVNKMRSDGRFEKMVQSMTVDRVAGRSSLAKNKFRW